MLLVNVWVFKYKNLRRQIWKCSAGYHSKFNTLDSFVRIILVSGVVYYECKWKIMLWLIILIGTVYFM